MEKLFLSQHQIQAVLYIFSFRWSLTEPLSPRFKHENITYFHTCKKFNKGKNVWLYNNTPEYNLP